MVHSIEIKDFGVHFLANLGINFDKIQSVATACWFVEAYANVCFVILYFLAQVIFKKNCADMIL